MRDVGRVMIGCEVALYLMQVSDSREAGEAVTGKSRADLREKCEYDFRARTT
jgi:hypothetical protein